VEKPLGPDAAARRPHHRAGGGRRLLKGTDFGRGIAENLVERGGVCGGRRMLVLSAAAILIGLSGCTYNPLLGKWKIDQRSKETYVSYVDPISSHIRKQTGNDTIEFRQNSVVISGGAKPMTEDGIHYQVTELEGSAGTEVKVYQPRKDDPNNYDIDTTRVTPDGKSAHLETPSEVVDLKKIEE
jgi:hypothetical protein